jgi:DNA-binding HxlR family transcriptional regulator
LEYIKGREEPETDANKEAVLPAVSFTRCPVGITAGLLGKKWTMLILRDIGFRNIQRFNRLLESIPGITPRVLSLRLKELEKEGYIECVERKSSMLVRWALTEKGEDALPILMSFVAFGSKWYADQVFDDKRPRTLQDIFKSPRAREIIERYARVLN